MSTEQQHLYPPHEETRHPWGTRRDRALLAWFGGIGVAGFALGTVNGSPGREIPTTTWAAEAALVGVGAGLLLGLFTPHPAWQGHGGVFVVVGAGVYSLAYVGIVSHSWEGDSGGAGLVFAVVGITCLVPMGVGAAAGHAVRATARRLAPEHDGPQPALRADNPPTPSTSEQPQPDQPPFWPPPPGWKPTPTESDERGIQPAQRQDRP